MIDYGHAPPGNIGRPSLSLIKPESVLDVLPKLLNLNIELGLILRFSGVGSTLRREAADQLPLRDDVLGRWGPPFSQWTSHLSCEDPMSVYASPHYIGVPYRATHPYERCAEQALS